MDSHDSESQTCSKHRGKFTFRDEALGATVILINTVSCYFSLLGFEIQLLRVGRVNGLVLAQIKMKSFLSFSAWRKKTKSIILQGAECDGPG